MAQIITSEAEFNTKIKHSFAIVDFYADWCGPCKAIEPEFKKLALEYPQFNFLKVNVDNLPSIATEYAVTAMPTFILFKQGKKIETVVGANIRKIKELLVKYANSPNATTGRVLGSGKTVGSTPQATSGITSNTVFYALVGFLILYLYFTNK